MNRSYQIKREVLAEKEEQERAMRAQIRAFRSQVKDLAKTISATLAADPMWSALPKCERDCVLGLMIGLFRQNLNKNKKQHEQTKQQKERQTRDHAGSITRDGKSVARGQ